MEQRLARLASARKGVVTTSELLRAGVSEMEIRRRVEKGLLIRQYRGVYRVGHAAPSTQSDYLAAVKACGEGTYLCGRAAAYHQGLLPLTRDPPPAEVMCPTERNVQGVRTRRCRAIHPLEVATHEGIPVTTVPRTLLDLAATEAEDVLARACHEAGVRWRTSPSRVLAVLNRHPRAKGAAKLRRVLAGETPVTLSRLERGFLEALDEASLPRPSQINRRVGSKRVDCCWPEHGVTVELDSYRFHNSRHSWEQDRTRDREARARGDELRRYTWADVFEDRHQMLTELHALLAGS
ncbi:MAG TPA: type IV toxin-antitoxin system AbiEi family antitoxin domain-containing protein [Thermoleophilaceae bacterium]